MELRRLCAGSCLGTFVIAAAMLLSGAGRPAPVAAQRVGLRRQHKPMQIHRQRNQTSAESYNWSGYAVTGSKGSVTDVTASWIVPPATCSRALTATGQNDTGGYASFWVGIDGWNSNTVEQIGTDSDCATPSGSPSANPTYYAWFEFYPQGAYYVGNPDNGFYHYVVKPYDVIKAEVSAAPGATGPRGRNGGTIFTAVITDETQGWTFTTNSSMPNAQQSSAEWIAETPYGCSTGVGYCVLSDFGSASYGQSYAPIPGFPTAYATVGGKSGPLGSFGSSIQEAIMVSYENPATYMATPTALAPAGTSATSFTITWLNAGP